MKKGILAALSAGMGATVGAAAMRYMQGKKSDEYKEMSEKHLALMLAYNQWMTKIQEGKRLADYFHREGMQSVAIYGMSYLGERVYGELKDSDIEIRYAIDRNAAQIYAQIPIALPEDELPKTDAIVVTPIFFFDEIESMLNKKTDARIISLEDILYAL